MCIHEKVKIMEMFLCPLNGHTETDISYAKVPVDIRITETFP